MSRSHALDVLASLTFGIAWGGASVLLGFWLAPPESLDELVDDNGVPYGFVETELGAGGIKFWQDPNTDGVIVLTCFQYPEAPSALCWDQRPKRTGETTDEQ